MVTKKDFLSEFWLFFHWKNDWRKIAKCSNQTYLRTSKKARIFLTINQKVFVTQEERLEEEVKEKKTFQVRNRFILMMNQQKVAQKQQSNVPFHFEKNGEKCKMKDLTVLSIEMKRGEKKQKRKTRRRWVSASQSPCAAAALTHTMVVFFATMHHDGSNTWCFVGLQDTRRPYQIPVGPTIYVLPLVQVGPTKKSKWYQVQYLGPYLDA